MVQEIRTAASPERVVPPMAGAAAGRKGVNVRSAAVIGKKARTEGEDRLRMIAEAAYFRAEQRGFAPGRELEDWLAAEIEVDALLGDED